MADNTAAEEAQKQKNFDEYMELSDALDGITETFTHEDLEKRNEAHRLSMDEVVTNLEERYASRGLKFTTGFLGSVPVQAFGQIDGMLFYFRYRGDYGNLRVGIIEEDRYQKEYERDLLFHEERVAKRVAKKAAEIASDNAAKAVAGEELEFEDFFTRLHLMPPVLKVASGVDDVPTSLRKIASAPDYLNDPYCGTLSAVQCEELFIHLVEKLEDVEWVESIIDPVLGEKFGVDSQMRKLS